MKVIDVAEAELAGMIDHTVLKPQTQEAEVVRLCQEAREYGFGAVCIAPVWVRLAVRELSGTRAKVASVIGFPHGNTLSSVKAMEASRVVELGAMELDMVINIGALKDHDDEVVAKDIEAVVGIARPARALVKVIIEAGLLTVEEKRRACGLARRAGADFVKTSTGFAGEGKGATPEDVKLMRDSVGYEMGVKAAGGIRDFATALRLIQAGATRLGCSSSIQIIREFRIRHAAE
jgi:deoxyribose-phosphate aldolase